jgi:hypothetical protein
VKLSESHVTKQCTDYLEAERWKCIRLQSGLFQRPKGKTRIRVGEPGLPDFICVRGAEFFFLEFKGAGGRLRPAQKEWIAMADERGFPVCVVDGLDTLREWLGEKRLRFRWKDDVLA